MDRAEEVDMSRIAEVDVALATYNGAEFLPEFLRSVAAQDRTGIGIIASDDGSRDRTGDILANFALTRAIHRNPRAGIATNFDNALANTSADYIALADQDDVWLPAKVNASMTAMHAAEDEAPGPVLVFSDLALVDDRLLPLHASFFAATHKDPQARSLGDFVLGNHIPGCAMLANRALIDLALPIPPEIRMHDWWIALVAAGLGRIIYVDQPLIQYRQHRNNSMGAPLPRTGIVRRTSGLRDRWIGYRDAAREARRIVSAFNDRYADRLSADDRRLVTTVLTGSVPARLLALRNARVGSGWVARAALHLLYRA